MVGPFVIGTAAAIVVAAGPVLADETFDAPFVAEYDAARQDWYAQIEELQSKESFSFDSMPTPPEVVFGPQFRAYAERHAGTPKAVPALSWLVSNPGGPGSEQVGWALRELGDRHAADEQLLDPTRTLQYLAWTTGREPVVDFCKKVLAVNQHRDVRAGVTFAMAVALYNPMLQGPGADPKHAATLFRQLAKEYSDTEFAALTQGYLFEIEHLQVGMKAPKIAGTSPTGEAIELSQFEGQVVVLDFWGFW